MAKPSATPLPEESPNISREKKAVLRIVRTGFFSREMFL
jgi:hypothetical protein